MEVNGIFQNSIIQNIFSQLGTFVANKYVPSDDCYAILVHICEQLNKNDKYSRQFRQIIGLSQVLNKDFLPMLFAVNNTKILEILIKILASILLPIESLIGTSPITNDKFERATIFNLNWVLATSKIECVNINTIKRIIEILKDSSLKLSKASESYNNFNGIIYDCLRFIKHILYTPNGQCQNQILWILLSENFSNVLIDLINTPGREQCSSIIIDVIALLFKNKQVDMSKLLSKTKIKIKDSSEDNESNTSIHTEKGTSSVPESSYGSNSEDNNIDQHLKTTRINGKLCKPHMMEKQEKKKIIFPEQQSIVYSANQNSNATHLLEESSVLNENNCEQKFNLPTSPNQPLIEVRIMHILQMFIIRFIRNGFDTLVNEFYNLLISNAKFNMDTTPYFWILTYFCKFCKLDGIEFKSIRQILSFEFISLCVYEGFKISEQLQVAKLQKSDDIHLRVRHLHLVIMSIKEVVEIIKYYILTVVSPPIYSELMENLKSNISSESIVWAKDLMSIFLSCIQNYDSEIQPIIYLHDLIVTNHKVLSLLYCTRDCWDLNDSITTHIKQFATPGIMLKYGKVLQNYKENSELVNDAILTMMYHIIKEVENNQVLFQPIISQTFLSLYTEKACLYEKWSDLIKHVIAPNKFNSYQK